LGHVVATQRRRQGGRWANWAPAARVKADVTVLAAGAERERRGEGGGGGDLAG